MKTLTKNEWIIREIPNPFDPPEYIALSCVEVPIPDISYPCIIRNH